VGIPDACAFLEKPDTMSALLEALRSCVERTGAGHDD